MIHSFIHPSRERERQRVCTDGCFIFAISEISWTTFIEKTTISKQQQNTSKKFTIPA